MDLSVCLVIRRQYGRYYKGLNQLCQGLLLWGQKSSQLHVEAGKPLRKRFRPAFLLNTSDIMSADDLPAPGSRKRPASLACYECRRKHLKCDGIMPTCARCASAATNCTYLPSRRGQPCRQQSSSRDRQWPANHEQDNPLPSPGSQHAWIGSHDNAPPHPLLTTRPTATGNTVVAFGPAGAAYSEFPFSSVEKSHLVGLYYSHFHSSHPILVPHAYFTAQRYPDFLVVAASLVGHHFASTQPPESALPAVISMIISAGDADNGYRVQAFILLALVSLGSHDMSRANDCLDHAVSLAMEANLDSLDSRSQGTPPSIMHESLRRTWWELFTVDALLALLQGRVPRITAANPDTLPYVPSAETLYEVGDLSSRQPSYAEFERRFFLQQHGEFSSHFYRIEAAFIVRRVRPLFTGDIVDPQELEAVCNAIASWPYHLPDSSFALSKPPGYCDQMLVQANLLVQVASIFLHFPRSSLSSRSPSAIDFTCLSKSLPRLEKSTQHGIRAIAASRELCHIASIPSLRDSRSPMAVCGFLLGSAVQLSTASSYKAQNSHDSQQCRHRVVLMLGALRHIGKVWSSGQTALHRVQPFADLVFTTSNDRSFESGRTPSSGDANAAPNFSGNTTLEELTASQDLEPSMRSTSQNNALEIDWFNFFQTVDPLGDLSAYGTV